MKLSCFFCYLRFVLNKTKVYQYYAMWYHRYGKMHLANFMFDVIYLYYSSLKIRGFRLIHDSVRRVLQKSYIVVHIHTAVGMLWVYPTPEHWKLWIQIRHSNWQFERGAVLVGEVVQTTPADNVQFRSFVCQFCTLLSFIFHHKYWIYEVCDWLHTQGHYLI